MNKTIGKYICAWAVVCLAGCSNEVPQEGQTAVASFHVATRAADNTAEREITDQQFVRLYVAERRPESGTPEATDPSDQYWDRYNVVLYCDKYYDLEGQTYHVENLPGVWHKFAFVCVPDISQGMGSGMFPAQNTFLTYKDLYDFAIDYRPVLDYQAALNEASKEDLAIYRKIIDRWVDTDMPTNERVLMRRVTGQLVLNMGKPADQFDTATNGAVTDITVSMKTARNCYIRDESCDSVLVIEREQRDFHWTVSAEGQLEEQLLPIALLPGELSDAKVTVSFADGTSVEYVLRGRAEEDVPMDAIEIKKNTRTIVLFNGKDKETFEVRYAGFADGNDATVDVDDDAWDGV